ncbi:glycosyltransferase family 4 protein [Pontibacter rugosus]|uniref:Glycosyltransferase family 4 protein n=1 Tax=Pontibacter rugosus TaxID=1745966 RepID=A0ABW3SWX3_9BACT
MLSNIKSALVHDWFYTNGGAEKCIKSFININPEFDIFGLIDFLSTKDRAEIINNKHVRTSFIQQLPTAKSNHRKFLPLFPLAIEQFDLSGYDLILSSSASVAKGVLTHANQVHISYCHSPMRYAWDLYHQYLIDANLTNGFKGAFAKYVLHRMRIWDVSAANRVDYFIANSDFIAKRIFKIYRREAHVIYPPVDTEGFDLHEHKDNFYLTASRLVPYKKIDLIVKAFTQMPDKKLIVIGDGPEMIKLKSLASKNIEFLGFQSFSVLKNYMQMAKAFVFAAEEDFGIVPVEAQACGTPVIAFGRGGSLETVIPGKTGVFFYEQTPASIKNAIEVFDSSAEKFVPSVIRKHAIKFSVQRFEDEMKLFIKQKLEIL